HFHYALKSEDHDSVANFARKLKTITKTYDIHLWLIVQPRGLREGERLSMATLRGGGVINQAMDNLLIMERVQNETNISRVRLTNVRHKLARTGEIYLKYDPETTKFEEVDKQTVVVNDPLPQGVQRRQGQPWPRVN